MSILTRAIKLNELFGDWFSFTSKPDAAEVMEIKGDLVELSAMNGSREQKEKR